MNVPLHVHKSDVVHGGESSNEISCVVSGLVQIRRPWISEPANFGARSRHVEHIADGHGNVVPHHRDCCPRVQHVRPKV